jgi:hypothetical protein
MAVAHISSKAEFIPPASSTIVNSIPGNWSAAVLRWLQDNAGLGWILPTKIQVRENTRRPLLQIFCAMGHFCVRFHKHCKCLLSKAGANLGRVLSNNICRLVTFRQVFFFFLSKSHSKDRHSGSQLWSQLLWGWT